MAKRHRPGFPLAGDWLAVHQMESLSFLRSARGRGRERDVSSPGREARQAPSVPVRYAVCSGVFNN